MTLKWLMPLGFLGLAALIVLIVIYVIKPQYKEKVITSTYIWSQALKICKKTPFDSFKNILLFLSQALALTACALILAEPNLFLSDAETPVTEKIFIVDASASMQSTFVGYDETRFEMAIDGIRLEMDDILMNTDGSLSVILADKEPHFLIESATEDDYSDVVNALAEAKCSFGKCDMGAAIDLARTKTEVNPLAKTVVYTGTEYGITGNGVEVIKLSDPDREWNIGVTDCEIGFSGNEYVFDVTVAAYGKISRTEKLHFDVYGATVGGTKQDLSMEFPVEFTVTSELGSMESERSFELRASDSSIGGLPNWLFSSYDKVTIGFSNLNDSLSCDDEITLYGGNRDVIRVLYYSTQPNDFFITAFNTMKQEMKIDRDITFTQFTELTQTSAPHSGFDIYIYEHGFPKNVLREGLPTDGVVMVSDPDTSVRGMDVRLEKRIPLGKLTRMTPGEPHPLTQVMDASRIGVTSYITMTTYSDTYTPLMYCDGNPMFLARNLPDSKTILMMFNINLSSFYTWDFFIFLYNVLDYYMPVTTDKCLTEVGESVTLRCKGTDITVTDEYGAETKVDTFPFALEMPTYGSYTVKTEFDLDKEDEVRNIFVKIPEECSSIFNVSDYGAIMNRVDRGEVTNDLFVYIAAALLVFLFLEWLLQFLSGF